MEKNLGELIFDFMTSNYNDNIDKSKDLEEYLNEKTKEDLLYIYLLYGYAGNLKYIEEDIEKLQNENKEILIEKIISFLDTQIITIFQFLDDEVIQDIKKIAKCEDYYKFSKNKDNNLYFKTIKILKQLNLIFCKKENDEVIIHMPKFLKDKVNKLEGESFYLEHYKEIILYSKGMADTYGAIDIFSAYEIISKDISIEFEKYDSIIKFVSFLELEPIYYSMEFQCISNFNIREDYIEKISNNEEKLIVYNEKMYQDIASDNYLFNLNEYKEFRKFLKVNYEFDINDDEILRGEIINDYIDICQVNENKAKENLNNAIYRYFKIDEVEKDEIINFIEKIKERMPKWMFGGKIENFTQNFNLGRNKLCPCGSGRKYKNCCGKNALYI